jgi:hypothetical protein
MNHCTLPHRPTIVGCLLISIPQTAKARLLNSKYPLGRKTYIQAAADHARQHNPFKRLQNLMDTNERDDALIEKLDHIIGECCDNGEKKCRKTRPEWWTLKVNRLRIWRRTDYASGGEFSKNCNRHSKTTSTLRSDYKLLSTNQKYKHNYQPISTTRLPLLHKPGKTSGPALHRAKKPGPSNKWSVSPWNGMTITKIKQKY